MQVFLVPYQWTTKDSQFLTTANAHLAHTPLLHAIPSPPESWATARPRAGNACTQTGLHVQGGISRRNKGNYSALERRQKRTAIFCVHVRNTFLQILRIKEVNSFPFLQQRELCHHCSSPCLLIHGPMPPSPCEVFPPPASSTPSIINTTSLQSHGWC